MHVQVASIIYLKLGGFEGEGIYAWIVQTLGKVLMYRLPPAGWKIAFLCDNSFTTTQAVIFKLLLTSWQEYRGSRVLNV